jgi:peptidoglycan/LPS O-acetylase OafA/YrhL
MTISITDPVLSTQIFIVIFSAVLLASAGKRKNAEFFSNEVSQELKGLAILAVVFSHIGYFLVTDNRFLFPLSIMAGVGVDIFLLLSGFGITMSSFAKNISIKQFYERRLLKLFIPFWLVIGAFFLMDFFILGKSYDLSYIMRSILGLFPHADLYTDLDSPLWYFTFILFYYLMFPLVFRKKYYWLSALIIYVVSFGLVKYESNYFWRVVHLYKLHLLAFPLGIALAGLVFNREKLGRATILIKKTFDNRIIRYVSLAGLLLVSVYFAYNSGVGGDPLNQELISLLVTFAVLGIFLIKKVDLKLFYLFGVYSYEVYLLHWPIMYRYDVFYKVFPAWLATILYLILFIFLGWFIKKLQEPARKNGQTEGAPVFIR